MILNKILVVLIVPSMVWFKIISFNYFIKKEKSCINLKQKCPNSNGKKAPIPLFTLYFFSIISNYLPTSSKIYLSKQYLGSFRGASLKPPTLK